MPRLKNKWHCLLIAALVAVFTADAIHTSRLRGRLQIYPFYDDVAYMAESLQWMDAFKTARPAGIISKYVHSPPHSPWQALLGIVAFSIAGVKQWAPYAANAINLVAMLLILKSLTGPMSWWRCALLWLGIFCTPLAYQAVVQFRPDLACGITTAGAILLLCQQPLSRASAGRRRWAGALFGMALLIKPSVFPLTLLLMGLTLGLMSLIEPREVSMSKRLRNVGTILLPAGLLALLYYPVGLWPTVQYVMENIFGRYANMWQLNLNPRDNLLYHLTGTGGALLLGRDVWLMIVIAMSGGAIAWWNNHALGRRRIAVLGVIVTVALAQPTLNKVKNEFLAATFDLLLVFSAFAVVAKLLRKSSRSIVFWLSAALLLKLTWTGYQHRQLPVSITSTGGHDARKMLDRVMELLERHAGTRSQRVLVTSAGTLNAHTLIFLAHRDGVEMSFREYHRASDVATFSREFEEVDLVVASEASNPDPYPYAPSTALQGEILAELRKDERFVEIGTVLPGYVIFKKVSS